MATEQQSSYTGMTTASWIALERQGQISRRLMGIGNPFGDKNTFLSAVTGMSATPEEMARWGSGANLFGTARGGTSWLASPMSVTQWVTSADMLANPTKYGSKAFMLHVGETFGGEAGDIAGHSILGKTMSGRYSKRVGAAKKAAEFATWDEFDVAAKAGGWIDNGVLTEKGAYAYINRALGLGQGKVGSGAGKAGAHILNPVRKAGLSMFTKLSGGTVDEAMAYGLGKSTAGGVARNIAASPTALGKYGMGALRVAGKAMWWLQAADLAMLAGEMTYKAGELYYYKIPKAFYSSAVRNAMRTQFSPAGPVPAVTSSDAANNRQRAIQAIQGSRMNARSALGTEASLMHGHFG